MKPIALQVPEEFNCYVTFNQSIALSTSSGCVQMFRGVVSLELKEWIWLHSHHAFFDLTTIKGVQPH